MPPSRPIRVALVAYRDDPAAGGSLRVAETLAQHLPADEVEARLVFAYGGPGEVAARVPCPVHYLHAPSARHLPSWRQARHWLRTMDFDLVHFLDQVNWIYLASWGLRAKRVVHFHGRPILGAFALQHKVLARLHRVATDAGIAISHGAKRGVCRAGWLPRSRIHVVHNAVNLGYFRDLPHKVAARTTLGLPQSVHLFGQVARLVEGNACLEIFDVLHHLPETWHAVLVGDGPLRQAIATTAKERGLGHRIHLTGSLGDVRPAYAALDMVVLLSRYQPFCLMLAEAMTARVPVAGLQGAGEYVEPEYPLITTENALFIRRQHPDDFHSREPDENYAKLARLMVEFMENHQLRERQVATAQEWVVSRFSGQSQGRQCLEVYRRILQGEPACG